MDARAPPPPQAGGGTPQGAARVPETPSSCPAASGRSCDRAARSGRGTRAPTGGRGTTQHCGDTHSSPATPTPVTPPPPAPQRCGSKCWAARMISLACQNKSANQKVPGDRGGAWPRCDYRRVLAMNPKRSRQSHGFHLATSSLTLHVTQTPPPPAPLSNRWHYPWRYG